MEVGYIFRVINKISIIVDVMLSFLNMVIFNIMFIWVFMVLVRLIIRM